MLPLFPNRKRVQIDRYLNLELELERGVEAPPAPAGETPAPVARIIGGLGHVGMRWHLVIESTDSMESAAITLLRVRPRPRHRPEPVHLELELELEPGAHSAGEHRSCEAAYDRLVGTEEESHSSSASPSTCGVACKHCCRNG